MFRPRKASSHQVSIRTPASTGSHDHVLMAPCVSFRSGSLDQQRRF